MTLLDAFHLVILRPNCGLSKKYGTGSAISTSGLGHFTACQYTFLIEYHLSGVNQYQKFKKIKPSLVHGSAPSISRVTCEFHKGYGCKPKN